MVAYLRDEPRGGADPALELVADHPGAAADVPLGDGPGGGADAVGKTFFSIDDGKTFFPDEGITKFAELGTTPVSEDQATPEAHRQKLESEIELWRPIIEEAGVQAP